MSKPYLHVNLWLLVLKNLPLETLLIQKCFRNFRDFSNRYIWKHRILLVEHTPCTHDNNAVSPVYRMRLENEKLFIRYYSNKYIWFYILRQFESFGMFVKSTSDDSCYSSILFYLDRVPPPNFYTTSGPIHENILKKYKRYVKNPLQNNVSWIQEYDESEKLRKEYKQRKKILKIIENYLFKK